MKNKIFWIVLFLVAIVAKASAEATFSADRIEEAAIAYLESRAFGDCEIEMLGGAKDMKFPADDVLAEFSLTGDLVIRGICTVKLKFSVGNRTLEVLQLRARVRLFEMVPVAIRNIEVGDFLYGAAEFKRMEVTKYRDGEIANKESIQVCVAKKRISQGKIVLKNIKTGQYVDVVVVSGPVQVYTSGQALTNAAAGERCRVKRDTGSHKRGIMTGWAGADGKVYVKAR